jgi:hypothetical protein
MYSDGLGVERSGFDSWRKQEIFLSSAAFRPALGPKQPPIQRVMGALSPEVKWPGREDDHSSLSSAEVKNGGVVPPFLPTHLHSVLN